MTTALLSPSALPRHETERPVSTSDGQTLRDRAALILVVLLAICVAAASYAQFWSAHRHLWTGNGGHDRNAHYLTALKLGLGLRHGQIGMFIEEILNCNVWPPLHGLVVGLVVAVAGPDYRLAVLPNITAWAVTAILAFLVARRAAPRGGNLAGLVAAVFVLVSPSHRGFASDLMLESLGACLSLAALYAYVVAVQDGSVRAGRSLALVMTALFLTKYNYWLLVVLALAAADLTANFRARWQTGLQLLRTVDWRGWIGRQLRHPLTWLIASVLLAVAAVIRNGDRPLPVLGRDLRVYPPHNIFHVAYLLLFVRLISWWRGGGRDLVGRLDARVRPLLSLHLWAVAAYMLLPRRPSLFLWFLSPSNAPGSRRVSLSEGISFYSQAIVEHYHVALWPALAVLALSAVALLGLRGLRPGGRAVVFLALIGAALTVNHPNHQHRYVHSWLAAGWITTGLGLALLLPRRPGMRSVLVGAAAAALIALQLPAVNRVSAAALGGPRPAVPSLLDVTAFCESDLDRSTRAIVLSTAVMKWHVQWTTLARYGSLAKIEERWYGFAGGGLDGRQGFLRWLETTSTDTIVLFDRDQNRPATFEEQALPECRAHAEIRDLLMAQKTFDLVKRQEFPQHGCTVWICA